MDFSSIFETIKGFFEANVLPTLKPIIDAIMGLIGGIMFAMFANQAQAKVFTTAMTYEILLIVVIGGIIGGK